MAKAKAFAAPISPQESLSIRKIENGYLVCRSGTNAKGDWKSTETFSPTKPVVTVAGASPSKANAKAKANALGVAMRHARDGGG